MNPGEISWQQSISPEAWTYLAGKLKLSRREAEVARFLLDDEKESSVADQLDLSAHTVHTHIERIYRKLNVNSRAQLTARLMQCFIHLTTEPDSPLPPICSLRKQGLCPFSKDAPSQDVY